MNAQTKLEMVLADIPEPYECVGCGNIWVMSKQCDCDADARSLDVFKLLSDHNVEQSDKNREQVRLMKMGSV